MKIVTVILTTYNSEKVIQRTLDSIYAQDGLGQWFAFELIVVDDMSTDTTPTILHSNELIFLNTEKNTGGPNAGRNMGLKRATGHYICIADHDDEWMKDRIIKLLPLADRAPIVTSGYTLIEGVKKTERVNSPNETGNAVNYYPVNCTFIQKLSKRSGGQFVYMGNIIYRAELKHILFEEEYGAVDFDWILRLFYQRDSVELCESLYLRHVEGENLSMDERYRLNDYKCSLKTLKHFQNEYPPQVKEGVRRVNGTLGRYYYVTGKMQEARRYLLNSGLSAKSLLYYLTTYGGAGLVKKYFKVFG
ncbi:MAG: glycosyltransferase family 2 protein [Bacteroidota bacterium]|nr:glycosyltransferase family 2 protein [Bacteroidota bacterium]